jgi:uncharacterized protein (DUF697 family)
VNLLALYKKLERLVQHLPAPLQNPILREILPIKTLFLQQRAPRILLLGDRSVSRTALANVLFGEAVAREDEDHVQAYGWQLYTHGHGKLRILDGRRPAVVGPIRRALSNEAPDVCLYLHTEARTSAETDADLAQAREILDALQLSGKPASLPALGVSMCAAGVDREAARRSLQEVFTSPGRHPFGESVAGFFVLQGGDAEAQRLATAIAYELPPEARLEMARLAGIREIQRECAKVAIKSIAAICGAIGAQPIPLADLPILTSLQAAMVAGIMHISGRDLNLKLGKEWITALGANIGIALALREGARAALKFVPVWGDVVSGGIAAAGTYAIGRAATAYFIDGVTLQDAQRLFRKDKPKPLLVEDR